MTYIVFVLVLLYGGRVIASRLQCDSPMSITQRAGSRRLFTHLKSDGVL